MSREATEARALTLAAQEALAAAFPDVAFTVETGHIRKTKDQVEVILRGEVSWTCGPAVALVQEVLHALIPLNVTGDWKLVCARSYTPAWATAMKEAHGSRVKISSCGYTRGRTAMLHPASATEEAEEELRQFRALLAFCAAPTERETN